VVLLASSQNLEITLKADEVNLLQLLPMPVPCT